jgi:hypothetical protein
MNVQSIKSRPNKRDNRSAFTMAETGVALAILAFAMGLVVQLAFWSMRERASTAARFVAIEQAANVLEAARATPWDSLNDEWAEAQTLPLELSDQLQDATLVVEVEPLEAQPLTKRVVVELRWWRGEGVEAQPLRMHGLFTRRSNGALEGMP